MTTINSWLNRIDKYLNYIAAAALFFMMMIIVIDVLSRAILNKPIEGVLEFTGEYLLVTITFFTISYAWLHGEHVKVEILVQKLSEKAKKILRLFTNVLTLIIVIALGITNLQKGIDFFEKNIKTTSLLEYPLAPAFIIISIGILMLILRLILETITISLQLKNGTKT